jgi:transposase-like protein
MYQMRLDSDLRFQEEEEAYRFIESCVWPNGAVCPRCGELKRVGRLKGASTRIGTYKCYRCRRPFTVKIGTMLEGSHVLMHVWLKAVFLTALSRHAIAAKELAKILEVSPRTADFISSRLHEAFKRGTSSKTFEIATQVREMSSCNPTDPPDNRQMVTGRPPHLVASGNF